MRETLLFMESLLFFERNLSLKNLIICVSFIQDNWVTGIKFDLLHGKYK